MVDLVRRGGYALWPGRASSGANPVPLPRDDDDGVVRAGKLWEHHVSVCPFCEITEPGCTLGEQMRAFYIFMVDSEPRRR